MTIRCVDIEIDYDAGTIVKHLTEGKEYEVIEEYDGTYCIVNDRGDEIYYPAWRFEEVKNE